MGLAGSKASACEKSASGALILTVQRECFTTLDPQANVGWRQVQSDREMNHRFSVVAVLPAVLPEVEKMPNHVGVRPGRRAGMDELLVNRRGQSHGKFP